MNPVEVSSTTTRVDKSHRPASGGATGSHRYSIAPQQEFKRNTISAFGVALERFEKVLTQENAWTYGPREEVDRVAADAVNLSEVKCLINSGLAIGDLLKEDDNGATFASFSKMLESYNRFIEIQEVQKQKMIADIRSRADATKAMATAPVPVPQQTTSAVAVPGAVAANTERLAPVGASVC